MSFNLKFRQWILLSLALIALGVIGLPMLFEQPLFFFQPAQIDNRMFSQPLVNIQAKVAEQIRTHELHGINLLETGQVRAQLPKAWVLALAIQPSKEAAEIQVTTLQVKGLPAFYQSEGDGYQVMIGPEVNKKELTKLEVQLKSAKSDYEIKSFQPAVG